MYLFSVIAKGQTWRNIAYLLLAFPLRDEKGRHTVEVREAATDEAVQRIGP